MNQYQAELYHHGIKGQKWGVRRFQNSDGTLTNAGKKRYDKISSKYDKEIDKASKNAKESKKNLKDIEKELSDVNQNSYNSKTFKKSYEDYMGESTTKASKADLKSHMDWLMDSLEEGRDYYREDAEDWTRAQSDLMQRKMSELAKYGFDKIKKQ
jgi:hypothetical protein